MKRSLFLLLSISTISLYSQPGLPTKQQCITVVSHEFDSMKNMVQKRLQVSQEDMSAFMTSFDKLKSIIEKVVCGGAIESMLKRESIVKRFNALGHGPMREVDVLLFAASLTPEELEDVKRGVQELSAGVVDGINDFQVFVKENKPMIEKMQAAHRALAQNQGATNSREEAIRKKIRNLQEQYDELMNKLGETSAWQEAYKEKEALYEEQNKLIDEVREKNKHKFNSVNQKQDKLFEHIKPISDEITKLHDELWALRK